MDSSKRTRVMVSDPLANVRTSPVRVNGSSVTNQGIEIYNDRDEWECINIHSANYYLVPNSLVAEITEEILADSGMTWEPTTEVWTGRYWAQHYMSDVSVGVPRVGDSISLGLRVENSYDGSSQFRLVLMAYVLSCTNGLVSPRHFTNYRMRHTACNEFRIPEAVSVLRAGMNELADIVPMVEALSEMPLSIELLSKVAQETPLPNGEWGHVARELGKANTAWDLMQTITHRLTHHGRGRSSLQYQERIGEYFLDHLVNSAA